MGPRQLGVLLLEQLHFNSTIVKENHCSQKRVRVDHIIFLQYRNLASDGSVRTP